MSQSNNQIGERQKNIPFTVAINSKSYQSLIQTAIKNVDRRNQFVTSIISAVSANPALMECTPDSILSGALLGESLNLSPSPQLGHFYLVPFKRKEKRNKEGKIIQPECTVAQFIIGYKGYKQLAKDSGTCLKLEATEVREGELIGYNPFRGEFDLVAISDPKERINAKVTGYYAYYKNKHGYEKEVHMFTEEMLAYADRYSPAFSAVAYEKLQRGEIPDKDMWKYSSFWYKDFDMMATKTMIRRLFNSGDVDLSINMQKAYIADGNAISMSPDGSFSFADIETEALNEPQAEYRIDPDEPQVPEPDTEPEEISFDEL